MTLSTMFADIKYLNELFHHLSREFSMECILAFVEFVQFEQFVVQHMNEYKNYYFKQFPRVQIKHHIALPHGIPRSEIVYGDNDHLVERYLHNDSGRIIAVWDREQGVFLWTKTCSVLASF